MFCSVQSAAISGVEVIPVSVEVDVSSGMPYFSMVGFVSSQVKEAQERVRTAIRNLGMSIPPKRITVNLAPGSVRKEGTRFDLPIAVAILEALGSIRPETFGKMMIIGELHLDGSVQRIAGVLPSVIRARDLGCHTCIIPAANLAEGRAVEGMRIIGIRHLKDLISLDQGKPVPDEKTFGESAVNCIGDRAGGEYTEHSADGAATGEHADGSTDDKAVGGYAGFRPDDMAVEAVVRREASRKDFSDIHGQSAVKRAAVIAAAGFHNLLLSGPPGSGKSMAAERIPTIMPRLSPSESLEISQIYSIVGLLPPGVALMTERPFRAPHHTITGAALCGGGINPKPGEITLAHRGVLFLDELPEMAPSTAEMLRQPLETHRITIARSGGTCTCPASFVLVAAMNPCPCGCFPDMNRCTCTPKMIMSYQARVSQALLDRIDLRCDVPAASYEDLADTGPDPVSSAVMREKVMRVLDIQKERYRGRYILFNSELGASDIRRFCSLTGEAERMMESAFRSLGLSARGYHHAMRVSRTIADLEGSDTIHEACVSEALCFRSRENDEVQRMFAGH